MKRSTTIVWILLAAASGMSLLDHGRSRAGVIASAQRGTPRELAADLLDGSTWQLSDHRGQVVALNLWATWCAPCLQETPALVRAVTDLGPQGFSVIGVSLDTTPDRREKVGAFRATYRINYPLAFPTPLSQLASGLDGIPTTLLFDRRGRAAKVYAGKIDEPVLRADVRVLLAEPLPTPASPPIAAARSGRSHRSPL